MAAGFSASVFLVIFASCLFGASVKEGFLPEKEVVDISIEALSGNKQALKKLAGEFNKYEDMKAGNEPFTQEEQKLSDEIAETLQLMSAHRLPSKARSKLKQKKILIEKPDKDRIFVINEEKIEMDKPSEDGFKFFRFRPGETRVFSGKARDFAANQWVGSNMTLKIHTLETIKKGDKGTEIVTLNEIYSHQDEWLVEQVFVTYFISRRGIQLQKNIVYNQPYPGSVSATKTQEPYWLARLPLREGDEFEGFSVESLTSTIKLSSTVFTNCLYITGQVEKFAFEPKLGLVFMEVFDQQWSIKKHIQPPQLRNTDLRPEDRKAIEKNIRMFCGQEKLKLDRIVVIKEIDDEPEEPQIRYAGDKKLLATGQILEPPHQAAEEMIFSLTLAYRSEKEDPDQKRYEVLRQKWRRRNVGGHFVWVTAGDE